MKKILILFALSLVLCSCKNTNVEIDYDYSNLEIISPTGAPSLAFLSDINNPNFETNSVPSNIISMMTSNSNKEVVVIDAVSGIRAIKKGAPYKLAGILTFGNFYIASTGNDEDNIMNADDKIILFGQGLTSDIIFHYLYGDTYNKNIEYVNAVSDAAKCLAAGKNLETGSAIDYVFIAEPVLTNILNNEDAPTYGKAKIYQNIQEAFNYQTGNDMIQAGLFLKEDGLISNKKDYLKYLENNINIILSNKEYVYSLLKDKSVEEVSTKYGISTNLIPYVLENNLVGLGFKNAYHNRKSIELFCSLFGIEDIDEEIYFK